MYNFYAISSNSNMFSPTNYNNNENDYTLRVAATNVRLLLKLMQDYDNAPREDDGKKPQLMGGIISILDDVRSQIIKLQPPANSKRAELRRCNTDLRRAIAAPKEHRRIPHDPIEENQRLHHHLNASISARKNLERMFSSLGKEKEIIAAELTKRVSELTAMQELVHDLRAENEMLSEKVKQCMNEHKGSKSGRVVESQGSAALQERNKALTEQLQRSLDGYRTMKRRYRDAAEGKTALVSQMKEVKEGLEVSVKVVHGLKERYVSDGKMEGVLNSVEEMLVGLEKRFDDEEGEEM